MKSILFPGKFLLGKDILSSFSTYAKPLGSKFLVIASKSVMGIAQNKIGNSLKEAGAAAEYAMFGGECSHAEIDRLIASGKQMSADCIVGIGGGKLLDAAKGAAYKMRLPVIAIPTVAATDAPCSALSVVYTEDGVFQEYMWLPANPNIVMVDSEVVCNAPARFLVAGLGDALATYFEARAVKNSDSDTCAVAAIGKQSISAFALAELCYNTLLADGLRAKLSVEAGAVTKALENIIEANILLSGIGFESGGLAGAHSIHNGLTVLPQTHEAYHGEKVAFGTLAQLVMENSPTEEINTVLDFCYSVGLPVTLRQIGLENASGEDLRKVADATAVEGETIHTMPFKVTSDTVLAGLKAANAIGEAYLSGK